MKYNKKNYPKCFLSHPETYMYLGLSSVEMDKDSCGWTTAMGIKNEVFSLIRIHASI